MTLKERLKAAINNFAWEQDWNIQEYAVHKRDIDDAVTDSGIYRQMFITS